jgi:dTDP-4-dehydrorhamnose reductase
MTSAAGRCLASARVLITGVTSIHGWPIYKRLSALLPPERLFGIRPPQMRIPNHDNVASVCMTDAAALREIRNCFRPTHVLHAAGVCDLDICESRPQYAFDINVCGAKNIVDVFSPSCYLMYLSADLVFSGIAPPPSGYRETDDPDPVSVVGKTFVQAEQQFFRASRRSIVRLGLPMGNSIDNEKGAIDFIEGRLRRNLPMSLFHDEWRSCIDCDELADIVIELFSCEVLGLFHCGGPRPVSLYEIGKQILVKGRYNKTALKKWSRKDDTNGPPRIGNVHLNSSMVESLIARKISEWSM